MPPLASEGIGHEFKERDEDDAVYGQNEGKRVERGDEVIGCSTCPSFLMKNGKGGIAGSAKWAKSAK